MHVILCKYTPVEVTNTKSRAMTHSRSLQCRAFSRAVLDETALSPLFPVAGDAVVTNDWCMMILRVWANSADPAQTDPEQSVQGIHCLSFGHIVQCLPC